MVHPIQECAGLYLDEIGAPSQLPQVDKGGTKSLPVFVSQIYEVYKAQLFNREYALLLCTSKDQPTPGAVEKHFKLAHSGLGSSVAFVFLTMPSFVRKRLVQRGIPFIVPGRQVYLPTALINLREKAKGGQRVPEQARDTLSAPAQTLLLYHLQKKKDANEWPLSRWGDVLGYSRSTITRVYKELSNASLCEPIVSGRHVRLRFPRIPRELWESALPYLRTPVRTRRQARIVDADVQLYDAGVTALARLTMIGSGRDEVYAMSSAAFEVACEDHKLVQTPYAEEGTIVVERWKYAPGVLSPDGRSVDRLSLYLSLRDDHDERIQAALTELLEETKW